MPDTHPAIVIGGGPAGLMAAETIASGGIPVTVYDAMSSPARKLLIAGRGGLNLTHAEPLEKFITRYGARQAEIARWLAVFGPADLRRWASGLGIETFVGSSGRVFPADMKAAPLLRAWLARLDSLGVQFALRHRWVGWLPDGTLQFETPQGKKDVRAQAVVLALGGASWPHLGATGNWADILSARGLPLVAFEPANCGFETAWTPFFRQKFAGTPLKTVRLSLSWTDFNQRGECVISDYGLEGSLIYAAAAAIRERIKTQGDASVHFDLLPDTPLDKLTRQIARPRGKRSWSAHLRRCCGLHGVKSALLREVWPSGLPKEPSRLAAAIKHLPIRLLRPRPLEEAISTAGGLRLEALTANLMLRDWPGIFCAGEMLDWEAPTGGYLLTACFASGVVAGQGVCAYLDNLSA